MKAILVSIILGLSTTGSGASEGPCIEPFEPFPYPLERSDPLYPTALDEHRHYLEAMEDYVNCLDRERGRALGALREAFERFRTWFGPDAKFEYDAASEAD